MPTTCSPEHQLGVGERRVIPSPVVRCKQHLICAAAAYFFVPSSARPTFQRRLIQHCRLEPLIDWESA